MQVNSDDDKSSSLNLGTRIFAGILIAGLVISFLVPVGNAVKNAFTDTSDVLITKKLSRVPVFTVTDSTGRPYLSETEDGKLRRGFFFVQPSDAEAFLKQVRLSSPTSSPNIATENQEVFNIEGAKVLAVSMNEVMKFLDSSITTSGPVKSIPERFELFPDAHELDIAQNLSDGKFKKIHGSEGVPVFYIEGLAFKDDTTGGNVIPVFFEKEKLDESLENLRKSDPNVAINDDDLQIMDFMQTVREIRAGADSRFSRIIFIPLTDALNTLSKMNASGTDAA